MNIKEMVDSNTILKINCGSALYGTFIIGTSDLDAFGVCITTKDYILGTHKFDILEQRTNPSNSDKKNTKVDNDYTVYSIQKYFKLLIDNNPNVLETLFVNEPNIIFCNDLGKKILDNKHLFLSKKAYHKFSGYAHAQKRKLLTKKPIGLRKAIVDKYGIDIKYSMHLIRLLLFGIELLDTGSIEIPLNEGIGIDLGIKDLVICSDKVTYGNINKTKKMKRLEKQNKRLQRQVSRKYEANRDGLKYIKTKNILKLELKIKSVQHKLNGVRDNYIQQTTTEIVKTKPSFVSLEDLNISGMMKNRHLSKAIQQQSLYEFGKQLKYKGTWNNIEVRIVDRWYPSSKTCHECGQINKLLKLSDREWICTDCGNVLDRDYNASLNLRDTNSYRIYKAS